MGTVIGGFLPFAMGIAISPLPIIVVILTLLSPNAGRSSTGFLLGWLGGIAALITVLTSVSGFLPNPAGDEPGVTAGIIKLILGALLLWLALGQWRKREAGGADTAPGWMRSVDALGFGGALRTGVLLSVANPKNVVLSVSVAVDLATSELDVNVTVAAAAIFVLLAGITILLPVLAYAVARERMKPALDAVHGWLSRESRTIMCVLFLLLGTSAIGNGIGILWP
ncbi:GAP family protein [Microbacterium sp. NPDC055903]